MTILTSFKDAGKSIMGLNLGAAAKVELAITPEGTYETRSGRTPEEFFDENEITYKMLDKDGKEYEAPNGVKLEPYWGVAELKKKEGLEEFEWNRDLESYDSMEAGPDKHYQIEAWGVEYAPGSDVEDGDCFVNDTTAHAEKVEEDAVNTAGETKYLMYTVAKDGYYQFSSADTNFSLAAGLEQRIGELKLGQSAQASVVGEDSESGRQATAAGFVFTAPKAGTYTFWSEGEGDTYGILYDIVSVDADTCLLNNGNSTDGCLESDDDDGPSMQFAIIGYSLSKGQTVYLKSMYHSNHSDESGSFTVQVAEGSLSFDD